jgi:hypothetical protein
MQLAAQIEKAPATARECRGHHGTHFVPVSTGKGRWVYYWLSLPQAWFWRSRSACEKAELVRKSKLGCFVCRLQEALESERLHEDGR